VKVLHRTQYCINLISHLLKRCSYYVQSVHKFSYTDRLYLAPLSSLIMSVNYYCHFHHLFLCPCSCLSLDIYCVILNFVWIPAKDKNASLLCEMPHAISGHQTRRSVFACWEWYVCTKTTHHFCVHSLSFPVCFSRKVRLHDKFCHQGADLINSLLEDVFPSKKIKMERSMGLFAIRDLFVDSANWNGKSRGIVGGLHK